MKVFVSWSGDQSKKVGEALYSWLPKVLQAVQPWFSPEDLGKGRPWAEDLFRELQQVKIGVFCLTPGNLAAPWIAFEAAACMSKADGRVFTYLHGVNYSDVTGPLSIFNHTLAEREGTFRLVSDMNTLLPVPLTKEALGDAFDVWWPRLESVLAKIPPVAPNAPKPTTRSDSEIVKETLEVVRSMQAQIAELADSRVQRGERARSTKEVEAINARWKAVDPELRQTVKTYAAASELDSWIATAAAQGIPMSAISEDMQIPIVEAFKALRGVCDRVGVRTPEELGTWARTIAGQKLFSYPEPAPPSAGPVGAKPSAKPLGTG